MPILDDLSKKISNVAQSTVQKSKELAETAKASFAINTEEREIDKTYKEIGRWYYSTKGQAPYDEVAGLIDIIDTSLRKIREIEEEAEEAKAAATQPPKKVNCPACGAEMDEGTKFCPQCHAMMPSREVILASSYVCPDCGAICNGPFCSQCGKKVL